LYAEEEEYELAIADFDEAIALFPRIWSTYIWRAKAFSFLGQYDQALLDMDTAVELGGTAGTPLFNRAELFILLGQHEEARNDLEQALQSDDLLFTERERAQRLLEELSEY
jgi:tetratricopeptide (TPR) repeat protein